MNIYSIGKYFVNLCLFTKFNDYHLDSQDEPLSTTTPEVETSSTIISTTSNLQQNSTNLYKTSLLTSALLETKILSENDNENKTCVSPSRPSIQIRFTPFLIYFYHFLSY